MGGGGGGAGTGEGDQPSTVALNLLCLSLAYYSLAYIFSGLIGPICDTGLEGTLPFELKHSFSDNRGLAAWVNVVVSMLAVSVIAPCIWPYHPRLWDYLASLAVLNFILSCIVTREAPDSYIWWVTMLTLVPVCLLVAYGMQVLLRKRFPPRTAVERVPPPSSS
ncbi:hypothetical protein PTSG_01873 [Salpingoeca rosetta]|uniref:Uncharacterized protein n=1 Tax=Salpingoeca rosetta (strain ATCC 50818 / BSB-021) TaxID=946362 RepID=F2TZ73_SALR5|nr:uncharacterized protein PTSG_01873 [Salpingoeca rosetta]EGD78897.1 hypothetical protein PTSG_01873 [Salpingoeca rosetta]|eukprot:XP_004997853.1 hypothetical protein PTSG_01873 [Salpingoeca rosetta]